MKRFSLQLIVVAAFVVATISAKTLPFTENDPSSEWESFKLGHNKVYESQGEEVIRRANFIKNKRFIDEFNAQNETRTFKLGLNHLSDLSESELRTRRGGFIGQQVKNSDAEEKFLQSILNDNSTVPDAVDWRKENRVTQVKDTEACLSDWAFATVGVLEGQEKNRSKSMRNIDGSGNSTKGPIDLSAQNLVDCVSKKFGCALGNLREAFEFVAKEGGVNDEASYPYEARARACRFNKDKSIISDEGGAALPAGDEDALKKVVARYGPVAVYVNAPLFEFDMYRGGIFYESDCSSKPEDADLALLVVGYGTDRNHDDYWILKNSWTPIWGEHGYMRLSRNHLNHCGIANFGTIATF